jgi:hypothetical protein
MELSGKEIKYQTLSSGLIDYHTNDSLFCVCRRYRAMREKTLGCHHEHVSVQI